jgi:hypothetical protein
MSAPAPDSLALAELRLRPRRTGSNIRLLSTTNITALQEFVDKPDQIATINGPFPRSPRVAVRPVELIEAAGEQIIS